MAVPPQVLLQSNVAQDPSSIIGRDDPSSRGMEVKLQDEGSVHP